MCIWYLLANVDENPFTGFVNANAKKQEQFDSLFRNLGLSQSCFVPQLFYQFCNNQLDVMAVKIVDDVLITGRGRKIEDFSSAVKQKYEVGTVVFGTGSFVFYGLQIIQDTDMSIIIHGDGKLEQLCCFPIDRHRRK